MIDMLYLMTKLTGLAIREIGLRLNRTFEVPNRTIGFVSQAHRRCNNLMFAIPNEIAYINLMVKAMDDIPFECVLGISVWFDVNGSHIQNKQVVEEEIS